MFTSYFISKLLEMNRLGYKKTLAEKVDDGESTVYQVQEF